VFAALSEHLNGGREALLLTKISTGERRFFGFDEVLPSRDDVLSGFDGVLPGRDDVLSGRDDVLPGRIAEAFTAPSAEDAAELDTAARNAVCTGVPRLIGLPRRESIVLERREPIGLARREFYLLEPFFPRLKMLIFGGGHISVPLCELAAKSGFDVTVADDRPSFADAARFPSAKAVICESFDRCFERLTVNNAAYAVLATRGHRHDADCLRQLLRLETAYIGMLASRRRAAEIKKQMLEEGYAPDKIAALRSPIGIDIGAATVEEIAVSVIAEVIAHKRGAGAANGTKPKKNGRTEFDPDVLDALSAGNFEQAALATVYETKGSAPRRAGAKMLVLPDGRTAGTVGGGCAEAQVIIRAIDVARNGGYAFETIDLTAIGQDDGMHCGGIMKVLIERV